MKTSFKIKNWPILVVIAVLFIHVVIFVGKFGSTGYSTKVEDWSDTSNFFNLIALIIFSILVYNYNRKRDSENDDFQRLLEKPTIGFDTTVISGKEVWRITNLGKGSALNIQVAYMKNIDTWENHLVLCYHLSAGQNRELIWLQDPELIVVMYNDIFDNRFLSVVTKDTTSIIQVDKADTPIGESKKINGITFSREEINKIKSLEAKRFYSMGDTNSSTTTSQTTSPTG